MANGDIQESTAQYDHTNGVVEFYFTSRSRFLAAIRRNGNYLRWTDLKPGYMVEYAASEVRPLHMALKPTQNGREAEERLLTPGERFRRSEQAKLGQNAVERMRGAA